jgi:hypothetical protein
MDDHTIGESRVFVKIEDYKTLSGVIEQIMVKLAEAKKVLDEIRSFKHDEDSELQMWESTLTELESKVDDISKNLF